MTQKTFWRRVKEIMNDQSSYPTNVPNLETWQKQQKEITERTILEAAERQERITHWFEQDAYVNGSLLKRAWMRIQFIFLDIKGEKHHSKIPDYVIQEMARCLLPDLIAFYESEEGMAAFNQWKAEQEAKKKEESKVA